MAVMAKWDGIVFQITSDSALLFQDLKLKAGCETKDKELNNRKYTNIKIGKGAELSMTVILRADFGIDVRETIMQLLDRAQKGKSGHLICGKKKIFPFLLRLVNAETEELAISPKGKWTNAKVNLSFKQASKEWIFGSGEKEEESTSKSSGGGGGSSSGGNGGYKKTYSTKSPPYVELGTPGAKQEALAEKKAQSVSAVTNVTAAAKTETSPLTTSTIPPFKLARLE